MPPRSVPFLKALLLVCCLVYPNYVRSTNAQSHTRQEPPPAPQITAKPASLVISYAESGIYFFSGLEAKDRTTFVKSSSYNQNIGIEER